MKDFFKVMSLKKVLSYKSLFSKVGIEEISITKACGRILAQDIVSDIDLPDFKRTTMDGYAIKAGSSFGASEANPAYLTIKGSISMGQCPDFSIAHGESARISTGGMLPKGADSVVMIEHTELLDNTTIEVYKSVAPGQHVIEIGEDFKKGDHILLKGQKIRPQEAGLLGAFGMEKIKVYKKPVISIISTGDEIVPVSQVPKIGQIRDINTYTLAGSVQEAGAVPLVFGIIQDNYDALLQTCTKALSQSDMVMISGGSSVGTRDFTIEVLSALPESEILAHGISISPGKPTILAKVNNKAFWGLPGHVVSAMVVFSAIVKPFIEYSAGISFSKRSFKIPAKLTRNMSSAQGRVDYVRVRLIENQDGLWAQPIMGKSGLINTMIKADGLIEIGRDVEGLNKEELVYVTIL